MPSCRQKKAAPFRFRRGGENSISAASFFLSKPEPFHWVPVWLTNGGCRQRRLGEFQSSKKRKRAVQNRNCKPCRHRVRRRLLRFASAGVAKTPHPHPPSSFPNCDRFTGSQFGSWKFYNAARDLDDGGQAAFCGYGKKQDFHTPQVQSKALVDGESREPSERFSGRLFLFFAVRHGSFLSPNRKRKEWGRKIRFLF